MDDKNKRIGEIQSMLELSQRANCHPEQYEDTDRLTRKQHFDLWDEMWHLMLTEEESKRLARKNQPNLR